VRRWKQCKEGKKERKEKERKEKERKGKERKGKERKGKKRKGKERKGKERKGKERKGKRELLISVGLKLLTALHGQEIRVLHQYRLCPQVPQPCAGTRRSQQECHFSRHPKEKKQVRKGKGENSLLCF
jgi:hypothetical protein